MKKYNRICYRCGLEFQTDDEEGFYCDKCFRELLKGFFESLKKGKMYDCEGN